jgi:PST family polysaccharide transporter
MAGLSIAPLVLVSLVQSTLYGLGEYRRVAHVTVWTNAVGLGLLLGLVSCCGTWGAVFQGVLLASLQLLACGWHLLSVVGWPAKAQPDGSGRSSLVTYGLLYLAIAAIQQGGILYVRREVLTTVGGVEAGVFTAVWGISWTYLALVVGSLQPYYLSEISGEGSSSSRSKCMSDVLRVLSAVQTPATLCAITLSAFLLQTLYTSQFRVGSGLLRLLALGDLLMAASWAVFVPLLAAKRLAWAFVIECTFWIVFVALTTLLLPRGLAGVFEACLWARVAQLVVAAVIFRAVLEFALPVRGVAAIVAAGCFVASVYAVRETGMSPAGFIAMFGCGGLWLVATVSVAEARAAFGRFRASLERN